MRRSVPLVIVPVVIFSVAAIIFVASFGFSKFKIKEDSTQAPSVAKRRDLVIWGVTTGADSKDFEGMKDAFAKLHPEIRLRILSMGAGGMNNQKLMTSIVGNVAPDIVNQDRFELSDWASRGAFLPLDKYIARDVNDPFDAKKSNFYDATWKEAQYDGKVYGIPTGADNRALYYNKDVFNAHADQLRAAGLDPDKPPQTWSQVLAYSKVLTEFNSDGSIKTAGFIPNAGNSWLYMYAFQNNAPFMSEDGKTCTLDTPYTEQAMKFMGDGYKILGGYDNDKKFESGFQTGEDDPFLLGKIAMKIDGDWIQESLAQYGPNVDFGTAPPPVPDDRFNKVGRFANEKDRFVTWVGGFAYAIPRNAKNVEDAWTFIKFATSVKGEMIADDSQRRWDATKGRTYVPRQLANRVANEEQLVKFRPKDPRFAGSMATHVDLMSVGRVRPPTVVSNQLWEEQVRAIDNGLGGKMTIKQALTLAQQNVQRDLNDYWDESKFPIIDLNLAGYFSAALAILATFGIVIWFKKLKLGPLDRSEAKWAFLFVSPWVIGFLIFTFGPMVASLLLSFTEWNVLNPAHFVWFHNYQNMFGSDWPTVSKAFYNAAYLGVFGVPLGLMTGLAVALLLNAGVKGMRYYRTLFYMPAIVPGVAATVLWIYILTPDPNKGLLNSLLHSTIQRWIGAPLPGWLSVEVWSKPALIAMGLWGAGSGMILWLAGMKGISNTLYEAASLDGASPYKQFWTVTLPMLSPIVFFNLVMGVIGAVQEFTRVFIIKSNDGPVGPADSLMVPVYHLFDEGFAYFKMGYASALAWLIFAVILILTAIQFKLSPRWVHTEVEK